MHGRIENGFEIDTPHRHRTRRQRQSRRAVRCPAAGQAAQRRQQRHDTVMGDERIPGRRRRLDRPRADPGRRATASQRRRLPYRRFRADRRRTRRRSIIIRFLYPWASIRRRKALRVTPIRIAPEPSTTPSCSTARSTCCSTTREVHVKAGDVLVQQATNHAWVNNGTKPCRIAFILIDGKTPAAWQQDWKP